MSEPGEPFPEADTMLGKELMSTTDDQAALALLKSAPLDQVLRLHARAHAVSNRVYTDVVQAIAPSIFQAFQEGAVPPNEFVEIQMPECVNKSSRLVAILAFELQRRADIASTLAKKPD